MSADWVAAGTLSAGGKALEYACWGPPPSKAMTLVLLHEGLGSVALWRSFPADLAAATGCGVIAYSRAGYGASDATDLPRPLDYMTQEAQGTLPDVLDVLDVQRAVLVGHSDGATIAAIYAGSVVDYRVRGVVTMAPHFFTEPIGLAAIAKAKQAYENGDLRARLAKYHHNVDCAFWGWCDAWLDPAFADWDVSDVIAYIRVPVLAIQGRDDDYGTLAQIDVIEDQCYAPVDRVVLDACGHAPFLDHGPTVVAEITGFCHRLSRIEAAQPVGL